MIQRSILMLVTLLMGVMFLATGCPVATPNQPPVAVINADPTSGEVALKVNFDGSNSLDPDGEIVSYEWDFGDGETDTGSIVTHTYGCDDTYTATLTVTDNDGASDSTTAQINVTPPPVLETIIIDATDSSRHDFTTSLGLNQWYRLSAESAALVSASETVPSQLHLFIHNGKYARHSYLRDDSVISREILIDAQESTLGVTFLDAPGAYGDNSGSVTISLARYFCKPPVNPVGGPTGAPLETIVIDGTDETAHKFATSLEVGRWYKLVIESGVLYSVSESTPSQLHLLIGNGDPSAPPVNGNPGYGLFTFGGDGSAVIRTAILIDAKASDLSVTLVDAPGGYGDNSGSVTITLEKLF
jgi:hypothetical protein